MSGFFDKMLGRSTPPDKGSSTTAKDRLKMVLTHDRMRVAPEKMRAMQAEIIAVIAKYIPEIDLDSVEIAIDQADRYQNKLIAEIPFTQDRLAPPIDHDGNDDLDMTLTESDDDSAMLAALDETAQNPALHVDDEPSHDEPDD